MNTGLKPWEDEKYVSRFWSRVSICADHECWEWQRGKTRDGYGVFHFGEKSIRTHRFSYQLHNGEIREHDCVCHSCDNPSCVNPKHLWIGTRADNNADKEAKGRAVYAEQKKGELNPSATLTTSEVVAIKVMARCGLPQARIAKTIGISNASVCMIVSGKRWGHLTENRVSAAVNAVDGIDTEYLETVGLPEFVGKTLRADIAQHELDAVTVQCDELQQQLEAERASLFAESQHKQQLEQQAEELVGVLESMLEEVAGCCCTTEAAASAAIQQVRSKE